MNKKGFTLVEILAVIIIIGIIFTLIGPTISETFFGAKQTINKLELKNIEESANFFAQDVFMCDGDILTILKTDLKYTTVTNCKLAKARLESGITVTTDVLVKYDYMSKNTKCTGNLIVRTKNNKMSKIEVDTSALTCKD